MKVADTHGPIDDDYKVSMYALAEVMDSFLNGTLDKEERTTGFVLLLYPLNTPEGRISYISNSERTSVICAIKEFLANVENRMMEAPGETQ